ncbi:hypothetical protein GV827_06985 [Sulfitobacter sp. JBTF-M27]|uniref:Uncharacterized protein n=1 Tax=Sulfitobacter sediminilitoris TaxID=2698830 RepID=A0A6P0CCC6_9RHOB|nr:hypothetical protein [Sulfitobacter sediminilitoris]NEK22143.1 hypothetical protein [Sulfitobacter sediminilitoris]
MNDQDPEIIYSKRTGSYLVDNERVEVLIYKSDTDPQWILEVVNRNGTSIVWDDAFINDDMAWRVFQDTVENEGIRAFLDEDDPRMTVH